MNNQDERKQQIFHHSISLLNDPKYLAREAEKLALYQKYRFNLIELTDHDVLNLDDILPRLLLKFGVQVY